MLRARWSYLGFFYTYLLAPFLWQGLSRLFLHILACVRSFWYIYIALASLDHIANSSLILVPHYVSPARGVSAQQLFFWILHLFVLDASLGPVCNPIGSSS